MTRHPGGFPSSRPSAGRRGTPPAHAPSTTFRRALPTGTPLVSPAAALAVYLHRARRCLPRVTTSRPQTLFCPDDEFPSSEKTRVSYSRWRRRRLRPLLLERRFLNCAPAFRGDHLRVPRNSSAFFSKYSRQLLKNLKIGGGASGEKKK